MKLKRLYSSCSLAAIFIIMSFQIALGKDNAPGALDALLTRYDSYLSKFVKEKKIPGVAVAIVANNRIVFLKGYGVRKVGTNNPIEEHTAFRIASLSKGFAAALTGILVKEGVLKWDDKVIKYLPDFTLRDKVATNNLTIRHLLSHTTGLAPHAYDTLLEANIPFDDIVKRLKHLPVICAVGECYGYQNVAFSLIRNVIEAATGKKYTQLLKEKILTPLQMNEVSFDKEGLLATQDYAYPHIRKNGQWISSTAKDTYYSAIPAAGINASAFDMTKWLRALLGSNPEVISSDIIEEICKPEIETSRGIRTFNRQQRIGNAYYGMGWRIFDYSGQKMIYHSGGLNGYLARVAFLPKQGIGIVVLQNALSNNPFVYRFFDMYFGNTRS